MPGSKLAGPKSAQVLDRYSVEKADVECTAKYTWRGSAEGAGFLSPVASVGWGFKVRLKCAGGVVEKGFDSDSTH